MISIGNRGLSLSFGWGIALGCLGSCGGSNSPEGASESTFEPSEKSPKKSESVSPEPEVESEMQDSPQASPDPKSGASVDPGESEDDEPLPSGKFDLGVLPEGEGKPNPDKKAICDIDFLFVIDNSGSMRDEQINLANSVPKFIKTIESEIKNLESFHVGVISTDRDLFGAQGGSNQKCAKLGGLKVERPRNKDDKIEPGGNAGMNVSCGPYENGLSFMTRKDDLEKTFDCAARLGTSGDGNERPMDALFASMGSELTAKGACNEGFFRKDAILVVVLITDEEDDQRKGPMGDTGSKGDPKSWHKQLMKFKGDRPEYVVVLSLIGHEQPNECATTIPTGEADTMGVDGAEISPRLKAFTKLFDKRGSVYDVCAKDYSESFSKAVDILGSACEELPPPV